MKYYKDNNNEIYAFNELQIKQGYAEGYTELTPEEVEEHLNPAPTPEEIKAEQEAAAKAELEEIDRRSIRSMRAVLMALVDGREPDEADVDKLKEHEETAVVGREKLP